MTMKVTSEPCFKNGSGLMMWQERNCCRCQKAVWYNAKLDRYPNYKCAVQRDIEHQAAGIMEINERSFHAAHETSTCPFFKGKEEKTRPRKRFLISRKGNPCSMKRPCSMILNTPEILNTPPRKFLKRSRKRWKIQLIRS